MISIVIPILFLYAVVLWLLYAVILWLLVDVRLSIWEKVLQRKIRKLKND